MRGIVLDGEAGKSLDGSDEVEVLGQLDDGIGGRGVEREGPRGHHVALGAVQEQVVEPVVARPARRVRLEAAQAPRLAEAAERPRVLVQLVAFGAHHHLQQLQVFHCFGTHLPLNKVSFLPQILCFPFFLKNKCP